MGGYLSTNDTPGVHAASWYAGTAGEVTAISPLLVIGCEECDLLVDRTRKSLDDLADQMTLEGNL